MPWVNAWVGAPNGRHPGNCRKMKKSPAGKAHDDEGGRESVYFCNFSAHADGERRGLSRGGVRNLSVRRVFRYLQIGTGPRRPPSACSEK